MLLEELSAIKRLVCTACPVLEKSSYGEKLQVWHISLRFKTSNDNKANLIFSGFMSSFMTVPTVLKLVHTVSHFRETSELMCFDSCF